MSMPPSCAAARSTKRSHPSSVRRSAGMGATSIPVARAISSAVSVSFDYVRAQMATRTPSSASLSAIALPMPSLAPVTSAALPFSRRSTAPPLSGPGASPLRSLPNDADETRPPNHAVSGHERQLEMARRRADQRGARIPIRARRVGLIDLDDSVSVRTGRLQRLPHLGRPGACVDAGVPFLDLPVPVDDHTDALRALLRVDVGAVRGADRPVGVADQREGEVVLLGEGLVLGGRVEGDAEDDRVLLIVFGFQVAEPATLRGSTRRIGLGEEPEDDRLAPEVRELHRPAGVIS